MTHIVHFSLSFSINRMDMTVHTHTYKKKFYKLFINFGNIERKFQSRSNKCMSKRMSSYCTFYIVWLNNWMKNLNEIFRSSNRKCFKTLFNRMHSVQGTFKTILNMSFEPHTKISNLNAQSYAILWWFKKMSELIFVSE